jgi:hypothetical protein
MDKTQNRITFPLIIVELYAMVVVMGDAASNHPTIMVSAQAPGGEGIDVEWSPSMLCAPG